MILVNSLWSSLIGYLLGCINPSYLLAKRRGFDIRKTGSGNAGASNAVITMGKAVGIISCLFDILKAYLSVRLAERLFQGYALIGILSGTSCMIGHMFPIFMGFRGGKGLACLGGMILAYDWRVFCFMLGAEIILAFFVNYVCFVSISAAAAFPLVYGIQQRSLTGAVILAVAAVCMILKHRENLQRIQNGTEARISFLWRRQEEIERIQNNNKS